jgi:Outer membrane protein beta-barrel domain
MKMGRLLAGMVLIGALAGSASGGPLIDPTLASGLLDATGNLAGHRDVLRFLDDPSRSGGVSTVPWRDALTPLGLGLGVSRYPSDFRRAVSPGDLLSPQDTTITTLSLGVLSDPLWAGTGQEGLRPYGSLGPAVFVTSLADITLRPLRGPSDLDVIQAGPVEHPGATLGLQAQAGLRYNLSKAWSIFGEYRLASPAYTLPGLDGDAGKALGVHRFQGGLSIQFR